MRKGRRIIILILMICFLLVGSQIDVEGEAQQPEVTDNVIVMKTGKTPEIGSQIDVEKETQQPEVTDNVVVMNTEETPEKDILIISEIMSGNLEHLEEKDEARRRSIEDCVSSDYYALEWRQLDLNGDGIDDLILQMSEPVPETSEQRIFAIFACYEDRAECIHLDLNDFTEYSFCGLTGELMYTAPSYGGTRSTDYYRHYHYDSEWNEITDYRLYAVLEYGSESESVTDWWKEKKRRYYMREDEHGEYVDLTFDEFKEIYETDMGFEYHSDYFPG